MHKILLQINKQRPLLFLFLILLLSGCGPESKQEGTTGAIHFSLGVESKGQLQKSLSALGDQIDCVAEGISEIRVIVTNGQNAQVASKRFACSLHSGTVDKIPPGTMTVTLDALDGLNVITHSARKDAVSVSVGASSGLGHIVLPRVAGNPPPTGTSTPPTGTSTPPTGTSTPATVELKIDKQGAGIVKSDPAGINCNPTCSAFFSSGTVVTVTATPDPDFTFAGFTSGVCTGTAPCTFTLNATTTISAAFNPGTGIWERSIWDSHKWGN
ncbi:MAG: hypothetical protein AAB035_03570 [Nitrospirota bacterium]